MSFIVRRTPVFIKILNRTAGSIQYRGLGTDADSVSGVTKDEYVRKCEGLVHDYSKYVDEVVNRWEKSNEVYYGKERDFENYPTVKQPVLHPKVRFGFVPDSWFRLLYHKTGATGPYVFIIGGTLFLLNKELLVYGPQLLEFLCTIPPLIYLTKKFGPRISNYFVQGIALADQENYFGPLNAVHEKLDRTVNTADVEIARCSAVADLVKAKEENIDLQLEVSYRERVQHVYHTVYRYLGYHVEREAVQKRIQQQHLTNWVVDQVIKGFTPAQEKETLSQCISDLRRMAQAQKAASVA